MVRIWGNFLAGGTYLLKRAEVKTGNEIESEKASKGHLPTRKGGG
jgi:hypothetical protein